MKTTTSEAGSDSSEIFLAGLKEVGKQFFYGLMSFSLSVFWLIVAAVIVTWGDFSILAAVETVIFLAVLGVFALFVIATASIASLFTESSGELRSQTEELKQIALKLALVPFVRELPGLVRGSRRWQKR